MVRVAKNEPCGPDDRRDVVVHVLPDGDLRINLEKVGKADLGPRLRQIFRTRVYRLILLAGDPGVQFREVAEVIDAASPEVDYISIATPALLTRAHWRTGICIDPNLPPDYVANPPR